MSKMQEILQEGMRWHESKESEYITTKKAEDLPDTIILTDESILDEVLECSSCRKAYRFTQGELNLMNKISMPLPRQCSNCRHNIRFARTNLPKLYDRICMKCSNPIRTSYAPERPEIVYCEKCYQGEFL